MFLEGIAHIEELSLSISGQSFLSCSHPERDKIMKILVTESRQGSNAFKKHIYPLIKGLTVLAYFTSERICKEVLKFNPIPGKFNGDVSYSDINKVWYLL